MLSRKLLPPELTPESVFSVLRRGDHAYFWLDSSVNTDANARASKSYLGYAAEVHVAVAGQEQQFLGQLRAGLVQSTASTFIDVESTDPRFALGWVGWFSYEFGQALMGINAEYDAEIPPAVMLRVRAAVEVDHQLGTLTLLAEDEEAHDEWMRNFELLQEGAEPLAPVTAEQQPAWRDTASEYRNKIAACTAAIRAGESYLLCLTSQVATATNEHPADVYLRLRQLSPSHHGGFISAAHVQLASASPEQFLSVNAAGIAVTKPIKGTRSRGATDEHDEALRHELGQDTKELAENLMIVDLMRNDFARVCELGSVHVSELHEIESYEQVHQMVSTVTGKLKPHCDAFDILAHCFPAGSMTGAPKHRSVTLLKRLEQSPRGLYSGCFGYFSHDGSADFAMVIRSIVFRGGEATIGSGGGITVNSNADAEIAEVALKAQASLDALNLPFRPVM